LSVNVSAQSRKHEIGTKYEVDVKLEELILIEDLSEELEDEDYFENEV